MDLARVKLILPDGTTKEALATPVSIVKSEEPWTRCELEDGSVVRVRPIVAKVLRTDKFDNDGSPIYQVMVGNIVFVEAAENLKRRQEP
jgi:hypothetical protein